jgi:hypothetical protein
MTTDAKPPTSLHVELPADLTPARFWRWLLLMVGLVTLVRFVYLAFFCPYTLVGDEAHYWEWSRRLDLSYYTKGPGIAWTIALGTRIFGDTELGVRCFAPLAGGVLAMVTGVLAASATGRRRVGMYAAACVLVAPTYQFLALLMTIDGPYAALWALTCWAAWKAIGPGKPWGWALVGLFVGIGCLYKYTALLVLPGPILVYLWHRRAVGRPAAHLLAMLLGLVLFLVATSPITIWNSREGWPTIKHLLGHLHIAGGDTKVKQGSGQGWHYSPLWTLNFIGGQIALVGPIVVLGFIEAWHSIRRRADALSRPPRGDLFLIATAASILIFYLAVSLFREPEGNWPIAGYLTLFALAGRRIESGLSYWRAKLQAWRALPSPRPRQGLFIRRPETFTQVIWHLGLGIGIGVCVVTPRFDLFRQIPIVGPLLPIHRFTGAAQTAAHAQRLLDQLRASTGMEPFILSTHYSRASQIAFYMPGHPTVYCCQGFMPDGRKTQYDFFADTDLRREDVIARLKGRPALLLEAWPHHDFSAVFDTITIAQRLDNTGSNSQPASLATGFRGFSPGFLPTKSASIGMPEPERTIPPAPTSTPSKSHD